MGNKINFKTLLDFSNGKYSYNDYLRVKYWFTDIKDDEDIEENLFQQWKELSESPNTKSLHNIFEKIQYKILLEEKKRKRGKSIWQYYRKVAAILFPIITISASIYFFSQPHLGQPKTQSWVEINVPEGARIKFLLPDSTTGWLNSGANLKYPTEFTLNRKVELTGEAFFKVRHIEHSDFTVGVNDMDIKVLGTQFNVSAYASEAVTEVVLKEGKVEINGKTTVFSQMLKPGEKFSYNHETKSLNTNLVDPKLYTAWTEGFLLIDNEPMSQIAKKLERWYGVDILIQDEALKNFRFKATFLDEPIEEILRLIAMTTPITYKIETRNYSSNGILKKKHIILKLKQ